jgi:predicted DCC family thiol-disulfide oxidoreductase YuxK
VDEIFYDGACGLCHFFVRFTVTRMCPSKEFFFSPLDGKAFGLLKEKKNIRFVPDSIAVYDKSRDKLYFKSEAVLYILRALEGGWKVLSCILQIIPSCVLNFFYDVIAKLRRYLFKKPKDICPIVPERYRKFFKQ